MTTRYELYYISLVYLVTRTYILFVLVRRKDSFGFQVLDLALLSSSARVDDEDDVPLVILYNGPHLLYTSHLSLGECEYGF